jgi:DNA-binding SARP family transcriptional activator
VHDVRFGLLGPLEIRVAGQPVPLPGTAERALLAQLLLSPGRSIPATVLVDRLWSESSLPVDPMNALQIRVSKLRRSLRAARLDDVVSREGAGYRAHVEPASVDAVDFVQRVREVRAATPTPAPPNPPTSRRTTRRWPCGGASR